VRKPNFLKAEANYRKACERRTKVAIKHGRDSEHYQQADAKARQAYEALAAARHFYGLPEEG